MVFQILLNLGWILTQKSRKVIDPLVFGGAPYNFFANNSKKKFELTFVGFRFRNIM